MYASISRCKTKKTLEEITRRVEEGFPSSTKPQGLKAIFSLKQVKMKGLPLTFLTISVGAEESNRLVADWVNEKLVKLLPNAPEVIAGG